ncbi:MAG: hypothetical protein KDI31_01645 [Pseudomonadales bacterium]|nr:hypothetical protein [Pseudomonadales bacterium]
MPRWLSARFNGACDASRALAGRTQLGGSWQRLPGDEARVIRELMDLQATRSVPAMNLCMRKKLPFYPGYQLYKFLRLGISAAMRKDYVVSDTAEVHRLDFASQTIPRLNETVPVLLRENTIADYLHFYFAFSHGRHGRFFLVESVDDLRFAGSMDPAARVDLASLIRPMLISRSSASAAADFIGECTFFFNNALFRCEISITGTGSVRLGGETVLQSDLRAEPVDHVT